MGPKIGEDDPSTEDADVTGPDHDRTATAGHTLRPSVLGRPLGRSAREDS